MSISYEDQEFSDLAREIRDAVRMVQQQGLSRKQAFLACAIPMKILAEEAGLPSHEIEAMKQVHLHMLRIFRAIEDSEHKSSLFN